MTVDQKTSAAAFGKTLFGKPARYATGLAQVAEQTWAWLQPNGELGESNAGLIAGDGAALLVDTLWDLRLTRRMLKAMAAVNDQPIATLVNTHSDGDHCWGNELVPGAEIVATTTARNLMLVDTPEMLQRTVRASQVGKAIGSLPLPLFGTLDLPKLPRLPLKEMATMMSPYDFAGIELTLPTRTFDGTYDLDVGGRAAHLIEVGPAHTAGDLIVWLPDVSVCFAADILFIGGTPIMWAGPVSSWIAALDTALGLGAGTYVPGHGPICGRAEVELLKTYFEWVRDEGVAQIERGVSPVKAARNLLYSREFETLPWATWDDPARLVPTLITERRAREGGRQVGGNARARAIVQMQVTVAELARRRR